MRFFVEVYGEVWVSMSSGQEESNQTTSTHSKPGPGATMKRRLHEEFGRFDIRIAELEMVLKMHGEAHQVLEEGNAGIWEQLKVHDGLIGVDRMISEQQGKRVGALEGKYSRLDMAIMALAKERDKRITALEDGRKDWDSAVYLALRGRVEALEQWRKNLTIRLERGSDVINEFDTSRARQEKINQAACHANNAQATEINQLKLQIQELQDRFPKVVKKAGRPEEKKCVDCKYGELELYDEPCRSCNNERENWEPQGQKPRDAKGRFKAPKTGLEWGFKKD